MEKEEKRSEGGETGIWRGGRRKGKGNQAAVGGV